MRRTTPAVLEDVPNVGPSIAADLRQIGIHHPNELVGQQPDDLYRALCLATQSRQDPCVLDVFISAVRYMEGAPPRPWWHYTAERKRRYAAVTAPAPTIDQSALRPRATSTVARARTGKSRT
jgi:hypothetical protein